MPLHCPSYFMMSFCNFLIFFSRLTKFVNKFFTKKVFLSIKRVKIKPGKSGNKKNKGGKGKNKDRTANDDYESDDPETDSYMEALNNDI